MEAANGTEQQQMERALPMAASITRWMRCLSSRFALQGDSSSPRHATRFTNEIKYRVGQHLPL